VYLSGQKAYAPYRREVKTDDRRALLLGSLLFSSIALSTFAGLYLCRRGVSEIALLPNRQLRITRLGYWPLLRSPLAKRFLPPVFTAEAAPNRKSDIVLLDNFLPPFALLGFHPTQADQNRLYNRFALRIHVVEPVAESNRVKPKLKSWLLLPFLNEVKDERAQMLYRHLMCENRFATNFKPM